MSEEIETNLDRYYQDLKTEPWNQFYKIMNVEYLEGKVPEEIYQDLVEIHKLANTSLEDLFERQKGYFHPREHRRIKEGYKMYFGSDINAAMIAASRFKEKELKKWFLNAMHRPDYEDLGNGMVRCTRSKRISWYPKRSDLAILLGLGEREFRDWEPYVGRKRKSKKKEVYPEYYAQIVPKKFVSDDKHFKEHINKLDEEDLRYYIIASFIEANKISERHCLKPELSDEEVCKHTMELYLRFPVARNSTISDYDYYICKKIYKSDDLTKASRDEQLEGIYIDRFWKTLIGGGMLVGGTFGGAGLLVKVGLGDVSRNLFQDTGLGHPELILPIALSALGSAFVVYKFHKKFPSYGSKLDKLIDLGLSSDDEYMKGILESWKKWDAVKEIAFEEMVNGYEIVKNRAVEL